MVNAQDQLEEKSLVKDSRNARTGGKRLFKRVTRKRTNKQFANRRPSQVHHEELVNLAWYPAWLALERANLPPALKNLQIDGETLSNDGAFYGVFRSIESYAEDS